MTVIIGDVTGLHGTTLLMIAIGADTGLLLEAFHLDIELIQGEVTHVV